MSNYLSYLRMRSINFVASCRPNADFKYLEEMDNSQQYR